MAIRECVKCGYSVWKMSDTQFECQIGICKDLSNWSTETMQALEGSCWMTTIKGMRATNHRTTAKSGPKQDGSNTCLTASRIRTELPLFTRLQTHVVLIFSRCTHFRHLNVCGFYIPACLHPFRLFTNFYFNSKSGSQGKDSTPRRVATSIHQWGWAANTIQKSFFVFYSHLLVDTAFMILTFFRGIFPTMVDSKTSNPSIHQGSLRLQDRGWRMRGWGVRRRDIGRGTVWGSNLSCAKRRVGKLHPWIWKKWCIHNLGRLDTSVSIYGGFERIRVAKLSKI